MSKNIGLQILRMIMSFFIIQRHCFDVSLAKNAIIILTYETFRFYTTTFFLISYFFSYKTLKFKNINRIKLRLQRFIIPYIIWPIFIFLLNNIYYFFGININHLNLKDLFIQLITGKRIYEVFWFQCNLIFTFILCCIIALTIQNYFLFTAQIFGIIGYIYHSLHYHFELFEAYNIEIRTLFQDFGKVLFFSSIGLTLASLVNIDNLKKRKKKAMLLSIFSLIIVYLINYFYLNKILYYLECIINIIAAISFFIHFSIIPDLNNKQLVSLISKITNYTGGVYYLHVIVWKILSRKMDIFKRKTLNGCFLNYIICHFICFIGEKIFRKSKLKYLFI